MHMRHYKSKLTFLEGSIKNFHNYWLCFSLRNYFCQVLDSVFILVCSFTLSALSLASNTFALFSLRSICSNHCHAVDIWLLALQYF